MNAWMTPDETFLTGCVIMASFRMKTEIFARQINASNHLVWRQRCFYILPIRRAVNCASSLFALHPPIDAVATGAFFLPAP